MRLHEFILTNREKILLEWDRFAVNLTPASNTMTTEALRDHADQMLTMIATDLQSDQSDSERSAKSKGKAPQTVDPRMTAAEKHGAGRAESGFTVLQVVAEYRALRSSVLHLWAEGQSEPASTDLRDMTRFNEALDQSLAEALAEFVKDIETGKDMLVAVIAHDLRTPLTAIYNWSMFLHESAELEEPQRTTASRIAAVLGGKRDLFHGTPPTERMTRRRTRSGGIDSHPRPEISSRAP